MISHIIVFIACWSALLVGVGFLLAMAGGVALVVNEMTNSDLAAFVAFFVTIIALGSFVYVNELDNECSAKFSNRSDINICIDNGGPQ